MRTSLGTPSDLFLVAGRHPAMLSPNVIAGGYCSTVILSEEIATL
jgi:hypothetical protein